MLLNELITRLQEIRNQTSGNTEVLIFDHESGCQAIANIEVMDCDDQIPDWINISTAI